MKQCLFFSLCLCCLPVAAESTNQVYNAKSQLTVENINEAVGILRNPTEMSKNFREAMDQIKRGRFTEDNSSSNNEELDDELSVPVIQLIGKVIAKDKPAKAVLNVNNRIFHVLEGSRSSLLVNRKIVNIRIDEIAEDHVTIFLDSPFNQSMVLH